MAPDIAISAAILAHIRGDLSSTCIAERFGVTEVQVCEWRDVFQVAGIVALAKSLNGNSHRHECLDDNFASTTGRARPHHGRGDGGDPTTKPARPKPALSQRYQT